MSKLSRRVRYDLRLSVSDRMEVSDTIDAMEAALKLARSVMLANGVSTEVRVIRELDAALAKLDGAA